jgi:hypothetical protein
LETFTTMFDPASLGTLQIHLHGDHGLEPRHRAVPLRARRQPRFAFVRAGIAATLRRAATLLEPRTVRPTAR